VFGQRVIDNAKIGALGPSGSMTTADTPKLSSATPL
jgi:hypothetical protein